MKARVTELIASLDRLRWVHWIVLRVLPRAIARRFVAPPDGLQATLELAIRDPAGREPTRFALAVGDGECRIRPGAADRPGGAGHGRRR